MFNQFDLDRARAVKAQAATFLFLISITAFIAVPRAIGGIAYSRMAKEGVCISSDYGTLNVWRMLFTGKLDGCSITHNAAVLQAQTLLGLAALVIALIWGYSQLKIYGPLGSSDILGAIVAAVAYSVAMAVVAVILIIWAVFWAFVIVIGILFGIVITSDN